MEVAGMEVASIGMAVVGGKVMKVMTNAAEFHYLFKLWIIVTCRREEKSQAVIWGDI